MSCWRPRIANLPSPQCALNVPERLTMPSKLAVDGVAWIEKDWRFKLWKGHDWLSFQASRHGFLPFVRMSLKSAAARHYDRPARSTWIIRNFPNIIGQKWPGNIRSNYSFNIQSCIYIYTHDIVNIHLYIFTYIYSQVIYICHDMGCFLKYLELSFHTGCCK